MKNPIHSSVLDETGTVHEQDAQDQDEERGTPDQPTHEEEKIHRMIWIQQRNRRLSRVKKRKSTTETAAQTFSQGKEDTCVDDVRRLCFESAGVAVRLVPENGIFEINSIEKMPEWMAKSVVNMILSNN